MALLEALTIPCNLGLPGGVVLGDSAAFPGLVVPPERASPRIAIITNLLNSWRQLVVAAKSAFIVIMSRTMGCRLKIGKSLKTREKRLNGGGKIPIKSQVSNVAISG